MADRRLNDVVMYGWGEVIYKIQWVGRWLVIAAMFALWVGCYSSEPTVTELIAQAEKLEKTKASSSNLLQDELRRLSADRALPDQIDGRRTTRVQNPDSFAAKAVELLSDQQTERILERMPEFFPPDRRPIQAITIESAAGFLEFYSQAHTDARRALDGPQSHFQWSAVEGWFADTRYTERATALCGLELIAGLDASTRGNLEQSIAALSYSGRIIRLLAEDGHLHARLAAVDLREKWLQLVGWTVSQPSLQREQLQQVYELLLRQMAQWPDESVAWIADRAVGLQTYELIRQGHYLSLLSKDEVDALEADGMHLIKARAILRFIDDDELFYLDIMRRLIDLHRFPFFERTRVLDNIEVQLAGADEIEKSPQIAANMLLPNTLIAMRRIANDRAICEAWSLGIAAALDSPLPDYQVNPITGRPYQIESSEVAVQVLGLGPDQWPTPLVIPRR